MGYDYNKHKGHGGGDSMWTSYSDLFLGLSIVFLLLYVTASLKQGTDGIKQHVENQKLTQEAADLRQQIKVYETLKQDYLKKEASKDEEATYSELMDKLTLLQDEQTQEKDKLIAKSKENEAKAVALNKYQQLVRNIINSNMIAKARIKTRDTMIDQKEDTIDEKDDTITEKSQEISGLEKTVAIKSKEIEKGESQIKGLEGKLDQRMNQLRAELQQHKITKERFKAAQAQAQAEADKKIGALRSANEAKEQELVSANNELKATSSRLNAANGQVAALGEKNNELAGELSGLEAKHKGDVEKLKGDFAQQEAKAKGDFDKALQAERLSGDQKAAREAKYKADAEARAKGLGDKLAGLEGKYKESQGALAKANENLNARKNLADQIKKNFAKAGVKADVDVGTGDVLLSFGDAYFESGHADLKPKMREILQQAMPSYSKSLFENDKISKKIQSVEIVGFASPTYKGKYIDPTSLNPNDRAAVNYNLDLSYARARSIFNYVFDKNKMEFKDQQRMLPLVKVTGRSFLTSDKQRDPATAAGTENFCRSNDCAKLQKVIIKFTLKD